MKLVVSLMKAFFGVYGVDYFIMKQLGLGLWHLFLTISNFIIPILFILILFIPYIGIAIYFTILIVSIICFFTRVLSHFFKGLLFLLKEPKEVEICYRGDI